jgi:uncharacterized membrane protein (UPF0127 family)
MFSLKPKKLLMAFNRPTKISLHMFFVFFSIDVVGLDKRFKIIEIKESFKPFSIYKFKKKVDYVLEAEQGFVKSKNLKIGDYLLIKYD